MSEGEDNRISVFVDGVELKVPPGTNMIEAAAMAGKEVPHYCYHPKLSVVGNCRMCLVEMGMPMRDRATGEPLLEVDGQMRIGWMPKPAIACATNAAPGMHIKTDSDLVHECRHGVMEFLLVNHPLDCPIYDQAGECRLQEFATDYGRGFSRFVEKKVVKPKRTRLGPRVMLDDERCILCSRCIRFCQEVPKDDVLGFVDRGSYTTLTCYPGRLLENNYSLNTVDICPVGALTSTDFRFKMRVWFLKETSSISTECSVGTNITVSSREGKIYRITPRRNDAVNDTWMPDSGRVLYKELDSETRLKTYTIEGRSTLPESAAKEAAGIIAGGSVGIVGSGRASVEEQFLLRKIAESVKSASTWLVARTGEGDGLLLSKDRNPNLRGALVTGLIDALPEESLGELGAAIDAGEVTTVVSHGEDLTAAGITAEQLGKVAVIYIGIEPNATSDAARVLLPGLTVFEKDGSLINQQFRVQRFSTAVPGPSGVAPDLVILARLLGALQGSKPMAVAPDEVWTHMSAEVVQLAGLSLASLPAEGQLIDGSRWEGLAFVEGASLHHEPRATLVSTGPEKAEISGPE